MAIKMRPYRLKYTQAEIRKIEKSLIETNVVYGWLREIYSKKKLCTSLKARHSSLYAMFQEPYDFMTLERLFTIIDLLPEREPKDILKYISNNVKPWYELENHEIHLLRKKLEAK